ncbi:MAG: hemolysin III family protein [Bacteroidia bacterium]|nr:hemolysin III family protein [Bacteroidia bacterium]
MDATKFYTKREEKANWITHLLGIMIAIVGTYLLTAKSIVHQNIWALLAFLIFGFGMFVCMLASTLYHYVQTPKTKSLLRHFDHGSIYVLIACSYSPFTLILLRNEGIWGWGLFVLVWIIALTGIGFNFGTLKANSHLKTASYVLMGMIILIAIRPSIEIAASMNCMDVLLWILIGGIFYIVGAIFYALAKREFIHFIFHLFVLFGMMSHIYAAFLIPL